MLPKCVCILCQTEFRDFMLLGVTLLVIVSSWNQIALGIHKGSDGRKGSHDTVQAGIPVINSAAL